MGCKVQSSSEVLPNKEEETDLLIHSTVYRNMTDANAFDNPRNKEMKEKRQKQATVVCSSFRITRLS